MLFGMKCKKSEKKIVFLKIYRYVYSLKKTETEHLRLNNLTSSLYEYEEVRFINRCFSSIC